MKRTLIVAELSANHGHELGIALESVRAAKDAGADAIKVQTYTPDTITLNCDNEYFQIKKGTIWDGTTLYKLYEDAYLPWEWHRPIKEEAERLGLIFFSAPFDPTAVDFLEDLGVPIYKIASFEITDIPLMEYVSSKGKPVIISTGIATLAEIEEAVAACRRSGSGNITLLKCTSEYPAKPEEANLRTIPNMRETFGVDVGLSDHTKGTEVAIAAVALGANVIEKHFILRKSIGGPDASFSMEPEEFKTMTRSIRIVESALGSVEYQLLPSAIKSRFLSRSLFAVRDIAAGKVINDSDVKSIRPGYGLPPKYLREVVGSVARVAINRGTPISWDLLDRPTGHRPS